MMARPERAIARTFWWPSSIRISQILEESLHRCMYSSTRTYVQLSSSIPTAYCSTRSTVDCTFLTPVPGTTFCPTRILSKFTKVYAEIRRISMNSDSGLGIQCIYRYVRSYCCNHKGLRWHRITTYFLCPRLIPRVLERDPTDER